LGVDHKTTTPYHPQCDGQAEIFNRTMQHYLAKVILQAQESTVDWEKYITPLMISHNTAVHKATMTTPHYAMFGYDPRVPLWPDGQVLDFEDISDNPLADLRRTQEVIRATVHHNNQHYREDYKTAYDKRRRVEQSTFKVGDLVWCKIHASNDVNKKLAAKWEEGIIYMVKQLEVYVVSRPGRKRHRHVTLGSADLRPRMAGQPPPPQEEQDLLQEDTGQEDEPDSAEEEADEDVSPDYRPTTSTRTVPGSGPVTRSRSKHLVAAYRVARGIVAAVAPGESFSAADIADLMKEVMHKDTGYIIYGLPGVQLAPPQPAAPPPPVQAGPAPGGPPPPPPNRGGGARQKKSYQERELDRLRPFLQGPEGQEQLPLGPRATRGRPPTRDSEEATERDDATPSTFQRVKSLLRKDKVGGAMPQQLAAAENSQHRLELAAEMARRSNERRAEDARRLAEQGWRPSDPPPAWPLRAQQPGTPPFPQAEGRPLPEAKKKSKLSTWSKGARKLAFSPGSQF